MYLLFQRLKTIAALVNYTCNEFIELTPGWIIFTGYGPKDWGKVSPNCDKSAQSPINIETSSAIKAPKGKGLKLTCDNSGFVSGKIVNNGHAPTFNIDKTKGTCRLTGGPLGNNKYKLQQLHFHFGCKDDEGSEHTVDDDAYSGEVSNVIVQ